MSEIATNSAELVKLKQEAEQESKVAFEIAITNPEELEMAIIYLGNIKTRLKMVVSRKEEITKPMNTALKSVRAFFSPIEELYEGAEKRVKEKMIEYDNKVRAQLKAEEDKIIAKVNEGKMGMQTGADKLAKLAPQTTISSDFGSSIQYKTIKDIEITDEKLIPREFLTPDLVKIKKVALAGVDIAGVKVIEKKIVASR